MRIFGADIQHARHREWTAIERRWGVLFQQGALWSNLTVKENVAAPMFEHTDMGAKEIDELADLKIALAGLPAGRRRAEAVGALGRHDQAGGPGPRPGARPGAAVPRRADRRASIRSARRRSTS